jgi:ATP-dependent helicase/nuclease subunit B
MDAHSTKPDTILRNRDFIRVNRRRKGLSNEFGYTGVQGSLFMSSPRLVTSSSLARLQSAFFDHVVAEKSGDDKDPFHPVVVLCGSSFLGHFLARELARNGTPHAGIRWLTFNALANELAGRALREGKYEPLPAGGKELIVRSLAREIGANGYFAGVHDLPHFAATMSATLADIEDSGINFTAAQDQAGPRLQRVAGKISEVSRFYDRYRSQLSRRRLCSEADVLIEASRRSADFAPRFSTNQLFVYGFYEVTGAQRELLRQLAASVNITAFLLSEPGGSSRLRVSAPFRAWWLDQGASEEYLPPEKPSGDLRFLRQNVFQAFAGEHAPSPNRSSVQVLSCPNETGEAREIARAAIWLKREHQIDFKQMAVMVRDTATYLPLLAGTFAEIKLPFYLRDGLPLDRSGAGRNLLALLRLPENDYRRDDVMRWLTLGAVSTKAPVTRWDRVSAEAGVVAGESQWREKLTKLISARASALAKAEPDRKAAMEYDRETAEKLLDFIGHLISELNEWRKEQSWTALADGAIGLVCRYHGPGLERDQVLAALDELRDLDRAGSPVDYTEFVEAAAAALAAASREAGNFERSGVHLLSLSAARHARFRVVFIPGLAERSFPQVGRQDPILLDEERRVLSNAAKDAGAGNELPLKSLRSQEEQFLFLLGLEAASERVFLTFPRAEAASGAAKMPSHFLLSSLECLKGRALEAADLKGTGVTQLRFVPNSRTLNHDVTNALDEREFDLPTVLSGRNASNSADARYLERLSVNFACAIRAEQSVWGSNAVSAYEGID